MLFRAPTLENIRGKVRARKGANAHFSVGRLQGQPSRLSLNPPALHQQPQATHFPFAQGIIPPGRHKRIYFLTKTIEFIIVPATSFPARKTAHEQHRPDPRFPLFTPGSVGGSPKTVAARLREYQALGVDVEKAYCVSEPLFPELGLPGPRGQLRTSFSGGRYGGNVRLTSAS